MTNINQLSGSTDPQSMNQLVRWITVKEDHATKIQKTTSEYFLTQKVKPKSKNEGSDYEAYKDTLVEHHKLLVAAMKCKQNADTSFADMLDHQIDHLEAIYKW